MATKSQRIQRIMRLYREQTGKSGLDMHDVVKFAVSQGYPFPKPEKPLDRLVREFAQAARDEIKYDKATGNPYRVNHAVRLDKGQGVLWYNIEQASRKAMKKSLIARREQMVGDGAQLTFDAEYWNSIHPDDEPIVMEMNFAPDILWLKNAPREKRRAR